MERLHSYLESIFDDLELVIGWELGFEPLRAVPAFVRRREEIPRLLWNPLCAPNLSVYLAKALQTATRGDKKIAVCLKGCDSRSLAALVQEKLVERERLHVVGLPCPGTIDPGLLVASRRSPAPITGINFRGAVVEISSVDGKEEIKLERLLARRCRRCRHPNPLVADAVLGEQVEARPGMSHFADVSAVEAMGLEARRTYWQEEISRCLRCYACRNACPLCICQDRCLAESRTPKWTSQRDTVQDKFFFHLIHAVHLAGRCTECGECERVCPVHISVALLKEKMAQISLDLWGYEPGVNLEAEPPLQTFDPSETGI